MPEQANTPNITGGCQCGAVRYALKSEPTGASICHCRMCQKAFGNYFAPLTGVPLADLEWTRGQPGIFKSSEAVERGFCRGLRDAIELSVCGARPHQRLHRKPRRTSARDAGDPMGHRGGIAGLSYSPHPAGHADRRRCDAGRAGDLEITAASRPGLSRHTARSSPRSRMTSWICAAMAGLASIN